MNKLVKVTGQDTKKLSLSETQSEERPGKLVLLYCELLGAELNPLLP